jgi:hypothetical protein
MPRQNFSIDNDVSQLLARLNNRSAYLCNIVRRRWQAWQDAHATLTHAGWDGPALCAACEALNGRRLSGDDGRADVVAAELEDAQMLDGVCGKWSVAPARWKELIASLRDDATGTHSRALCTIVEEYWAGNTVLATKIHGKTP